MAKRRLEIDIIVDERGSTRGLTKIGSEVDTLESRLRRVGATGTRMLGGAVVASAAAAAYGIKKSVDEAREANKVGNQSAAVIKSTGGAAKVSAEHLAALSGAVSLKAGIDDEAIQSGANLLLTFKEIHNEAGRGNDIFDQSTQTIVDMSVALDQDLKSSAIQVGKALNDPIKGLTALQRVGVSFSEQKAEQIKQWVEEGDILKAQKAILKELNSEFGGSAAAQADSFDKLKVGVENAEEQIGQIFIPILSDAADEITREFLPRIERAGGAMAQIFDRKDLSFEDKLTRSGRVIKREFGDLPPIIAGALEDALPIVASRTGHIGVAMAKGTIEGFIDADVWGKVALAGILLAKFGGRGAFMALGRQMGSAMGVGMATSTVPTARTGILASVARSPILLPVTLTLMSVPFLQELEDELKDVVGESTFDQMFPDVTDHLDTLFGDEKKIGRLINSYKEPLKGSDPLGLGKAGKRSWEQLEKVTDQKGRKVRKDTVDELDRMARQGGQKGDAFQRRVGGSFEDLAGTTAGALQNIGANVSGVMKRLGASDIPDFALTALNDTLGAPGKANVGDLPNLGPGRARGGAVRVAGQGVHDTVPLTTRDVAAMVAPGEDLVVLNRHQRPMVDAALASAYGVQGLPGFFDAFDRPHYLAKGGLVEPRITGSDPLRGLAQAGVHKAFLAGQEYIDKHRPKGGGAGGAGFSGASGRYPGVSGDTDFVPALGEALSRMASATGTAISVTSGWRSYAEQARLYQLYQEGKGNLAAPPGSSNHEDGRAADISPGSETFGSAAGKFGLGFTVPGESWHIELLNRGGQVFAGGGVIKGRVSYFNGDSPTTASGTPVSQPGLALNLNPGTESGWDNAKTRGWMEAAEEGHPVYGRTTIAGKTANLPIIDLGPAGSTGRAIDVTEAGVRKLGLDPSSFPTDSIGTVQILGEGGAGKGEKKKQVPTGGTQTSKKADGGATRHGPWHGAEEVVVDRNKKGKDQVTGVRVGGQFISMDTAKPGKVPESAAGLPDHLKDLLTLPGLTFGDREAIGGMAASQAAQTEGTEDDVAAAAFQEDLYKGQKARINRRLAKVRKELLNRKLPPKQRKRLLAEQTRLVEALVTAQGNLDSARNLDLGEGAEADEDPAIKADEEAKQAAEELAAATRELKEEMERTRKLAESGTAINASEAERAVADMLAGYLGPKTDQQAQVAGIGSVGTL